MTIDKTTMLETPASRLRRARDAAIAATLMLAAAGCARDNVSPVAPSSARPRIAFEAARARCGVTVAETPEVQRCMRAQGWAYRLPWE